MCQRCLCVKCGQIKVKVGFLPPHYCGPYLLPTITRRPGNVNAPRYSESGADRQIQANDVEASLRMPGKDQLLVSAANGSTCGCRGARIGDSPPKTRSASRCFGPGTVLQVLQECLARCLPKQAFPGRPQRLPAAQASWALSCCRRLGAALTFATPDKSVSVRQNDTTSISLVTAGREGRAEAVAAWQRGRQRRVWRRVGAEHGVVCGINRQSQTGPAGATAKLGQSPRWSAFAKSKGGVSHAPTPPS